MLYKVKGILIEKTPNKIILDINCIALELNISLNTYILLPECNNNVELFTSLFIRDDTIVTFGFKDIEEKKMFHLLNKVSSIGPTLAINILSGIKPIELKKAILSADKNVLCGIPRVGKKTAERIILELKDKFGKEYDISDSNVRNDNEDVLSALINLGYKKNEIIDILKNVPKEVSKFEDMIRYCLKKFSKT
jgi:Holliday junction DNA helicase RuvA